MGILNIFGGYPAIPDVTIPLLAGPLKECDEDRSRQISVLSRNQTSL